MSLKARRSAAERSLEKAISASITDLDHRSGHAHLLETKGVKEPMQSIRTISLCRSAYRVETF